MRTQLQRNMTIALATIVMNLLSASSFATEWMPWAGPNPQEELALPDLNGHIVELQQYRGKVVLINFWASWCSPCREEMPELEDIHHQYAEQGLVILSVNLAESKPRIVSFLKAWFPDGVPFPVIQDRNSQAYKRWRVRALPSSFLVDRQGKIIWHAMGSIRLSDPSTAQRIKDLLQSAH